TPGVGARPMAGTVDVGPRSSIEEWPRVDNLAAAAVDGEVVEATFAATRLDEHHVLAPLEPVEIIPARIAQAVARQLARDASAPGILALRIGRLEVLGDVGVAIGRRHRLAVALIVRGLVEICRSGRKGGGAGHGKRKCRG